MNFFEKILVIGGISILLFPACVTVLAATSTASNSVAAAIAELSAEDQAKQQAEEERQQLEWQIERRNQELEAIKKAIETNEDALSKVQGEKSTLQKELDSLRYQKNILLRQIQSDEVNLERLDLEIRSLSYDIQDIGTSIEDHKKAMRALFRQIQRQDSQPLLALVLKSNSLADALGEVKNLFDLNARLSLDVTNLSRLNTQYGQKLADLSSAQAAIEQSQKNRSNRTAILASKEQEQKTLVVRTQNEEDIYQRHLQDVIRRQSEIAAEIEELDAKLRGEINVTTLPSVGKIFISPVEGFTLTQGYGATSFARYGYRGRWHNGIDLRAPIGTAVVAPAIGTIEAVGDQDRFCPNGAYGKFVVINHPNNLVTLYAHLSRVSVSPGDQVKQGEVIGYSGSTGYATGPHLHFTVFAKETFQMRQSRSCGLMPQGGDIDPRKYF
ncbi:MAG: peptidoglycan DD-metalloendopeptidase family protein [Anaplasmataceae bacterium]|nr:peptidoglycan DD-metalloendopeptidase family protein [Anaplasmataceae bacterium]